MVNSRTSNISRTNRHSNNNRANSTTRTSITNRNRKGSRATALRTITNQVEVSGRGQEVRQVKKGSLLPRTKTVTTLTGQTACPLSHKHNPNSPLSHRVSNLNRSSSPVILETLLKARLKTAETVGPLVWLHLTTWTLLTLKLRRKKRRKLPTPPTNLNPPQLGLRTATRHQVTLTKSWKVAPS